MATPFMSLVLPTPTITLGPLYAFENNTAFAVIDSHNHTTGNGAPIPSSAININADLSFNSFNASLLRSARFADNPAPLVLASDIRSLYVVNGDLYYNNGSGFAVQITAGGAIDASSIGAIGGDYATSTASLFYTSATQTFTFWSNTNTPAFIDSGPITIRNNTVGSNGVKILPSQLAFSDYNLFLPQALPTVNGQVLISDTTGHLSFASIGGSTVGAGGYATIAAAIAATAAGGYITVNAGTYTENITLNKNLTIVGQGHGTVVNGTWTFQAGSDDSLVRQIKFGQGFVVDSGVQELQVDDMWIGNGYTITDNSGNTSNYYQGMQE